MTILNMTNEIQVKGTQNFMGVEIPVIEGGFGTDKKCITDKTIAEIHNMKVFHVRELIKNNIKRFKKDIDIIDLLSDDKFKIVVDDLELKGSNRTKNIFLLSERGYAKLIKIMDTDLAWEIHDRLMDEYFTMREIINSNEQLKANLLLQIYNGGQEGVIASKQLTEIEVQEATTPLLKEIEELSPMAKKFELFIDTEGLIDITTFSKNLSIKKLGRNNMYKYLRDNKYLMKDNQPYQEYVANGMFVLKPSGHHIQNGEIVQDYKTYLTKKGINKLLDKITKDGYIK